MKFYPPIIIQFVKGKYACVPLERTSSLPGYKNWMNNLKYFGQKQFGLEWINRIKNANDLVKKPNA